ncbi:MAG: cyclodeaminase [Acidimicrobiia bacterium]|nr:cyclodeaminase [Acidimicrobiia bacterium]
MGSIRVLVESELRSIIGLDTEALETIESVYPLISSGEARMPPILRIDVPEHKGEVDVKSAYLPGHPGIAVKVSAGFFDNPARGLPSLGGLMILLDAETGLPLAALFDNGYLTDIRTALAGAVAARHLARPDASSVALIGAGVQARLQLEALQLVRDVRSARVWARDAAKAEAFAREVRERTGIEIEPSPDVAHAVVDADVVVTATPATSPLVTRSMIAPGTHVTAVGSDAEHKQELAVDLIAAADPFVCDSIAQSERLGELRAAREAGAAVTLAELGAVIEGRTGRGRSESITVCDLTGTGAQDTAIAGLAVSRAGARGLGTSIAT